LKRFSKLSFNLFKSKLKKTLLCAKIWLMKPVIILILLTFVSLLQAQRAPLSDDALMDTVQRAHFEYFWSYGHPISGLSRERSNKTFGYGDEVVTSGGTGFGVMAIVVAADRKWITRAAAVTRLLKMVNFLAKSDHYHGVFPHWLDGATGKTVPFSRKDDGGDLVETSYLMQGLICAREYFNGSGDEQELRNRINWLWNDVEWNWHIAGTSDKLYWHWSPNNGWSMNFELRGWNECLITYVMAASSPRYPISAKVYKKCWAKSDHFKNGKSFYGVKLPLGFDYGGPLFFSQYTFLGLDPHGLKDKYADYWEQNYNHTLINYKHCVQNPKQFKGYGANCWGLTASDSPAGYDAHSPDNDLGVISPTAALSAMPYLPKESMAAMRHFYFDLGDKIWSPYGFYDAFSEQSGWVATSHLAIDQGPIVVMIENHRSGLLWKLFMNAPEIQKGLRKLGFESPYLK
jgi:hypothetical protein